MPETRELQSVVDAAEHAAAAGDFASAEQLLRKAALLQETSLGPLHPDLANTLNNLGVVCEITEKPLDAERYFRRAWEIATAVLDPNHPFVATSRKNLEDFCRARGKPVDVPARPPAVTPAREAPAIASAEAPRKWSGPLAIGALIAGGLLGTFIATAPRLRSNKPASPATTVASPPGNPISFDTARETKPTGKPSSSMPATAANTGASASVAGPPVVAAAHLCRDLSTGQLGSSGDWQCVPPSLPVGPGPLFFYTRLKSPIDTTVQHRWYRGDRLRQIVELRVRANPIAGYRTYSRNTVNDQDAAEWRVELRTTDGILLHEKRFTVR